MDKQPETNPPIVYATPVQRIWAWVGVVYMIIATLLVTYFLATGTFLTGLTPLMMLPVLTGSTVTGFLVYRQKKQPYWFMITLFSLFLLGYHILSSIQTLISL